MKAWEGPVVGLDSPDGHLLRKVRATETMPDAGRNPGMWSEKGNPPCSNLRIDRSVSGVLAHLIRERWLAKPVGSESRYQGDEVAGPSGPR